MTLGRPDDPASVVHVHFGGSRIPGCRDSIVLRDSLSTGPCERDPVEHAAARRRYWDHVHGSMGGLFHPPSAAFTARLTGKGTSDRIVGAHEFGEALRHFPDVRPVVLWSTRTWLERLALWSLFDAIARLDLARRRFWIAEPTTPGLPAGATDDASFAEQRDGRLNAAFSAAVPLTDAHLEAGSALWRAWVDPSPLPFDEARRCGDPFFPDLGSTGEVHGWLFPRLDALMPTRFRLSRLDQELLDGLDERVWARPVEVIVRLFRDEDLRPIFLILGDRYLAFRLLEWTRHAPDYPAVESRPVTGGVNAFTRTEHRLTSHGVELRERGFRSEDEVPPMHVGGCALYTGRRWYRRDGPDGWHLESA